MLLKLIILSAALIIDRFVGDPPSLWRIVPHPVVLFGKALGWGERRLNHVGQSPKKLQLYGMGLIASLVAAAVAIGVLLEAVLGLLGIVGLIFKLLIVAVFLAQKSLADHVGAVAAGLENGGLAEGRQAVSMIVGRNPDQLDEGGVCRAAIESLAENASDGVVAPAFWFLIGGLPGLLAYKMINTADSMIGHLNDRYRHFGRFAARLDDVANLIPARLTGLLAVIAARFLPHKDKEQAHAAFARARSVMLSDARLHSSPNAGWPEAAFAGALNLALAGPRQYGRKTVESPMLNAGGKRDAKADDIHASIRLFWLTMSLFNGLFVVASVILIICQ